MIHTDRPISLTRGYRLQWEAAQDCHVLLYPEGLVRLNRTAGSILSCVDGQRNLLQIVEELGKQYPGTDLEPDITEFLETAVQNKWVTVHEL